MKMIREIKCDLYYHENSMRVVSVVSIVSAAKLKCHLDCHSRCIWISIVLYAFSHAFKFVSRQAFRVNS